MNRKNDGFIGLIILIIIALAALKYFFNWSIFDALSSGQGRATVQYIEDVFVAAKNAILQLWSYLH